MKKFSFLLVFLLASSTIFAQIVKQNSKTNASFRGIHAFSDKIVWACGSNGAVIKTDNGGTNWSKCKFPIDSLDLRDIHVFSPTSVLVMSAGEASQGRAKLFQTLDGGENWILSYESKEKGVFFDSFDFWDAKNGILLGDPIDGKAFLLKTDDGGAFWKRVGKNTSPNYKPNEATFAASGNSIVTKGKGKVWFCTQNRIFLSDNYGDDWKIIETPFESTSTSGIFGIHFWDEKNGIIVGGDYKNESESGKNVAITNDGGITWQMNVPTKLYGLKEAVYYVAKKLIAVGASGVSTSSDNGKTWDSIENDNYHTISCKAKKCWMVGKNGNVAKIEY
jgi:photosystem II stability/assembly factor-like uncharacterized protein